MPWQQTRSSCALVQVSLLSLRVACPQSPRLADHAMHNLERSMLPYFAEVKLLFQVLTPPPKPLTQSTTACMAPHTTILVSRAGVHYDSASEKYQVGLTARKNFQLGSSDTWLKLSQDALYNPQTQKVLGCIPIPACILNTAVSCLQLHWLFSPWQATTIAASACLVTGILLPSGACSTCQVAVLFTAQSGHPAEHPAAPALAVSNATGYVVV